MRIKLLINVKIARVNAIFRFKSSNGSSIFVILSMYFNAFLAHLSRRLIGELIVYQSSRHPFTFSNRNISATSWLIGMKFYLKHHWAGGKASVGFDTDRIRTLVSIATDSSYRVIIGKNGVITFS